MEREPEGGMGLRQVDRGVDRRNGIESVAKRTRLLEALNRIIYDIYSRRSSMTWTL